MNLTAVAIVAIVFWGINQFVSTIANRRRGVSDKTEQLLNAEITELKQRVAVLERIVTDEKYDLKKEFDALKDK